MMPANTFLFCLESNTYQFLDILFLEYASGSRHQVPFPAFIFIDVRQSGLICPFKETDDAF
jgi:hypothetical protein